MDRLDSDGTVGGLQQGVGKGAELARVIGMVAEVAAGTRRRRLHPPRGRRNLVQDVPSELAEQVVSKTRIRSPELAQNLAAWPPSSAAGLLIAPLASAAQVR